MPRPVSAERGVGVEVALLPSVASWGILDPRPLPGTRRRPGSHGCTLVLAMVTRRGRKVGTVTLYEWQCKCERCGHAWVSIGAAAPVRCASCKAPGWNRPARWTRRRSSRAK